MFYDDFENDTVGHAPANWSAAGGSWAVCQLTGLSHELCETSTAGGVATPTIGNQSSWTNYHVDAFAARNAQQSPAGGVAILGRMRDAGHFYQLELRSDYRGGGQEWWYIWKYDGNWTEIAGGPFTTHTIADYQLRLAFAGDRISAYVAYDYSSNFVPLGSGTDDSYTSGGVGLRVWNNGSERFDDVRVTLDSAAAPVPPPVAPPPVAPPPVAPPPVAPPPVAPPPVAPPPGAGTLLWKIGDSYVISEEGNGSDVPIMSGGTASFAINRSSLTTAAPEYRNTASIEVPAGNKFFLSIGGTYAFRFNLANTMTADTGSGAQMLLWQVANNGQAGLDNPPLAFQLRTIGGVNYLALYNYAQGDGGDGSIVWKTPYVASGSDSWEFDVHLSKGSDGYVKIYKDGTLAYTYNGLTVNSGAISSLRTDFGV